jgi:phenylacetate-CoA ligase
MYWDKEIETLDRTALEDLQLKRLKTTLQRAGGSLYYGRLCKESGFGSDAVRVVGDIEKLPMTTKDDLRDNWPYGFLAVSRDDLVRLHSSSGTTGRAIIVFHTANDIEQWTSILARSMYMTGMRRSDVFQNMMTYGLFTGGLGFHYGAERIGALTIPAGAGNSKRQIQIMRDFETTTIHVIPSYALHLMSVFEEMAVDPRRDTKLERAFIGAEPHSEKMRRKLEEFYGFKAYNSYGLSEMCGPGVAFECPAQNGMHIWEDHFLVEVVDPQTLKPLPDGEEGELVLTTLVRDGMPIVRYRTKDLTRIVPGPCECGRTHRRIDRIKGRTDDMMIIKGVNIFPVQIERKLMGVPGVGNNFLILLDRVDFTDQMTIKVEVQQEYFMGDLRQLEALRRRIVEELKSDLLITPKVDLVGAGSLPQSEGKAKRVQDNRKD